ncbi:MAG: hypothetical protein WCS94_18080 [Verrucomicrobiota bacterium]
MLEPKVAVSTSCLWEMSTILVQWQVLAKNIASTNGLFQFTETKVMGKPMKYYRLSNP